MAGLRRPAEVASVHLLLLLALLVSPTAAASPPAADVADRGDADVDCEALGFTGLGLCSDCDLLTEYVSDKELEADCRRCCAADAEDVSKQKFHSAVLEVCKRRVHWYPAVLDFIEERAHAFPALQVKYRANMQPRLVTRGESGDEQEAIRIDTWKSEQIEEFLRAKIHPAAAEAAAAAA